MEMANAYSTSIHPEGLYFFTYININIYYNTIVLHMNNIVYSSVEGEPF